MQTERTVMTSMRNSLINVSAAIALLACACACALACACLAPGVAFAASMDQLQAVYVSALRGYENALDQREQASAEIEATEREIEEAEQEREQAQEELGETATAYYKDSRRANVLLDIVLRSESFQDAVIRYDLYQKVERRCAERMEELEEQRDELESYKEELQARRDEIDERIEKARRVALAAEKALLEASHVDGHKYHQVQGNGSNCGATAFIVGVNILLNKNRFTDNVKVWEGPGFKGDSTNNLASRGKLWLVANKLDDEIGIEEVKGDIHKTSELKELLDDGNVVVISSGAASVWQYADGTKAGAGAFPDGHWVVFYRCDDDDIFYCNDSAVSRKKGAGCAYTKKEMQQWLDGRANHFATVLYAK